MTQVNSTTTSNGAARRDGALATATVTVNAAFLQEIKQVNRELYDLLQGIRDWCANDAKPSGDGRKLVEAMAQLRDHLALHFALEEAYGYFEDPVYVAPRLGEQAESLRNEHRVLYMQFADLVDDVEGLHYSGRLGLHWHVFRQRFLQLDDQLQTHEARENELILAAYDDDIGVGD